MPMSIPLASQEARWFFEGGSVRHADVRQWFEQYSPYPRASGVGPPVWRSRKDGKSDIYLLVPGAADIGIKWREGDLQVKGRVADLGTVVFAGRHAGRVERWVKWSYGALPGAYRDIFERTASLDTVTVHKTRALRKIRLGTFTGAAEEVAATTLLDRGLNIEMTDLSVDGRAYCSVAFEAFPDDSAMHAAFNGAVSLFLEGLTSVTLSVQDSRSYPHWLRDR